MTTAYQINAYQNNAYQIDLAAIPAFEACAFQFGAFQSAPCPAPPEPVLNDGHDAGRKKALKKLKELEDKRIKMVREQGEERKMMLKFAFDPEAKAAHEAKLAAANQMQATPNVVNIGREAKQREIDKIDLQIARIEKMQKNAAIKQAIQQELGRIQSERQIREAEIAYQIKQADEELALMLMM